MATFWRSNQVDPGSTESNINIGSSGKGGEKKDDTVRVEDGNQADSEIDSKDTIEPKQKKKKKKSKKKKTQETSEKQAALAQDEQEQGQATQQGRLFEALYDYKAQEKDELSFTKGEVLTNITPREDGWWEAENAEGKKGNVPSTYLKMHNKYKGLQKDDEDEEEESEEEEEEEEEESEHAKPRKMKRTRRDVRRESIIEKENIGSSGEDGEKKVETGRVKDGNLADSEIDIKDSIEPTQEKKLTKSKRKRQETQESSEEQAALAQDEEEQGQATQKGERIRRHVAKVAKNCIFIPETKVVMYSDMADCMNDDWAQLISDKEMNLTNKNFKIEVINTGNTEILTMGLVPANYDQKAAVGWCDDSVGYHTDNGGIYISNGFATTNLTPAKKGDILSLRIAPEDKERTTDGRKKRLSELEKHKGKASEGDRDKLAEKDKWIYHFEVKNQNMKSELRLNEIKTGFYPCLAMLSRGAAVRLLDEALLKGKGDTVIPTMSSTQIDGLIISPAETISLKGKRGMLYGLMSIFNNSKQKIAFEVQYGEEKSFVLDHEKAWAESLGIPKDNVPKEITIEWATQFQAAKGKNWTLDEICKEKADRRKYTLKVIVEIKEEQDDISVDDSKDTEQPMTEQLFELLRSPSNDAEVEELTDRLAGSTDNFFRYTKARPDDFSIKGLLQILENASCSNKLDESMMIENVQRILKHLRRRDILQVRDEIGETTLHFAANLGSTKLIAVLLKKNKRIKYLAYVKSGLGELPLQIAIRERHDETATALVNMMTPTSIVNLFWNGGSGRIRLSIKELLESKLIKTTRAVLGHFQDGLGIEYLVAPLELDNNKHCPNDKEEYDAKHPTAYQMIARDNLEELANHECLKSLTEYKWRKYGRFLFLLSFMLYLIFWVALTTAIVTGVMAENVMKYENPVDYVRLVCEVAALGYALLTLFGECLQLKLQRTEYFADAYNYLDFSSCLLVICAVPLRCVYSNAQWGVLGIGYIIWTFRIFKFLTVIRGLGHLGHMILRLVVFDIWKFVLYYLVILFGFSGGLLLTLKGDSNLDVHNETSTFWGILFVGVRVLIEGQPFLDYTGTDGYRTFSCIIMLLFLASTCVVMLNIFIAQLSSRYQESYELVEKRFESHRAATIAKLERGDDLTSFIFLCHCCKPLWVQHFEETVYTCKIQRDGSPEIPLQDLYRWGGMKRVLRHLCRFLKYIMPCWIHRKCREAEWDDDSDVSDCESTCEECCENQCYCKPLCCRRRRRSIHFLASDSSSFDVTSTDESSYRF